MNQWQEAIWNAPVTVNWCNVTNAEYRPGGYQQHPNAGKIAHNIMTNRYEAQNLSTAKEIKDLAEDDVSQALRDLDIADSEWS